MKYYLYYDKQQYGPLELDELKNHTITPQTLVWHDGLANWLNAEEVEDLKFLFIPVITPPPIPSFPPPVPASSPPAIPPSPPQFSESARTIEPTDNKSISPFKWFYLSWEKAFVYTGRARRSEFWYFFLINAGIFYAGGGLAHIVSNIFEPITYLYGVISIFPSIAVAIRRMHDVGESGWFSLIPVYDFVLAIKEGDKGPNQYGKDPKQV